ncbi:MAG: FtsX-like permease family protein [Promethearchaeota archaeon]
MKIPDFLHRLGLMVQFSRMNLKYTIVTVIGLTIGLSLLSTSLIQFDSLRADYYYTKLMEHNNKLNLVIQADGSFYDDITNRTINVESQINSLISNYNLANFYEKHSYFPYAKIYDEPMIYTSINGTNFLRSISILGLTRFNQSMLSMCVEGSRFPKNYTEVLVFVKNRTVTPITLNQTLIFPVPVQNVTYNASVTVVGLVTLSTIKNGSTNLYDAIKLSYGSNLDNGFILTNLDYASRLITSIKTEIKTQYEYERGFRVELYFRYLFNLTSLTREIVVKVEGDLFNLFHGLMWPRRYEGYRLNLVSNNFYIRYDVIQEFEGLLSLTFGLTNFPLLIIASLLVSFSLSFINEKRKKTLALIKMRGVSNWFVSFLMLLEMIIAMLGSSFLALMAGIPLSVLFGSSTSFLAFNRPLDPSKIILTRKTAQDVLSMAGLLVFLLYFTSLINLSRSSISSLSQEVETKRRGKIQMLVGKVDIFFLTIGSFGVISFYVIVNLLKLSPYSQGGFLVLYWSFMSLLTLSPLIFALGFASTCNRFIPRVLHKLSHISWHRNWRSVAIATRNLLVSYKVITRTTLLITMTLAVVIMFSISSLTTYDQRVDDVYYRVGSEISFSYEIHNIENIDVFNLIVADLQHVSGFAFTIIKEWHMYYGDPYNPDDLMLMGIEADFTDFAHWQTYYDDDGLTTLVTSLFDSNYNNSAIVSSKIMEREHLMVGSFYTIFSKNLEIPITIAAVTNYWPRMFFWDPKNFVITQASYAESTINITSNNYRNRYNTLLGKILPGYDKDQVVSTIKQLIHNRTRYASGWFSELNVVYEHDALQEDSLANTFLWSPPNINIVMGLVVIGSSIVLFGVTRTLQHIRTLALSRSLGMKNTQLFRVMFTEIFLLFIFSGILGAIMGGFSSSCIFLYMRELPTQGVIAPLHIDLTLMVGYYTGIFILIVAVGLFMAVVATRISISKILKVE